MAALGAGAAVGRLWRCALRTLTPPVVRHQVKRFLLTEEILKLQEFQKKKLATLYNLNIGKDVFFQSINEKLEKNNILLKSELLALLHLCQTPADVEFAKQVIYRYQAENKNVMFGEYRFGPVVVRLCYELDLEDTAIALVKDQSLGDFFRDSTSYSILMDLLFTKGQYEKALDVLLEMRNQKVTFYGETYILAFAICYKLNNTDSYKICSALLDEVEMNGMRLPTQAYCFAVAFALKKSQYVIARHIYSQIRYTNGKLSKNVALLVKLHNEELEDVLDLLETAANPTGPVYVRKPEFSEQVMATIEEHLQDTELEMRYNQIYTKLKNSGQIIALTLDDLLCFTPRTNRHHIHLLKPRTVSRRTFQPLQSPLLAE
uniref:Pentatricopeptide repeat-containing protein 2, mitochondrial n=1 Tax=Leptobrachium leishanense TaxID=445787 RepID=A0A8C5LNB1_9ANUR